MDDIDDFDQISKRNAYLKRFGMSYKKYLCSEKWQSIRHAIIRIYDYHCVICLHQSRDLHGMEVHHTRYILEDGTADVLSGRVEGVRYLLPLCNECHRKITFMNSECTKRRSFADQFRKLSRMLLRSYFVWLSPGERLVSQDTGEINCERLRELLRKRVIQEGVK